MISATLWVRGPDDTNWRINAVFHRRSWDEATLRAAYEAAWYSRRGYRIFIGPEAPELDVPLHAGEVG